MLTENDDDRTPLSPSERAAGYLRLVSLGCTVRRLAAKVGRSAKHVSTHMALLKLPERAQLAVDAGELSMADVAALVKVKDQPELIEEVLALPAWNRHDIAMVIERRIAQRRQEEAYAEAVAEQEAEGQRVIESTSMSQSKAKRLRDLGFKVADHKAEPCHAVVVERYLRGVDVVEVCDDIPRNFACRGYRVVCPPLAKSSGGGWPGSVTGRWRPKACTSSCRAGTTSTTPSGRSGSGTGSRSSSPLTAAAIPACPGSSCARDSPRWPLGRSGRTPLICACS